MAARAVSDRPFYASCRVVPSTKSMVMEVRVTATRGTGMVVRARTKRIASASDGSMPSRLILVTLSPCRMALREKKSWRTVPIVRSQMVRLWA